MIKTGKTATLEHFFGICKDADWELDIMPRKDEVIYINGVGRRVVNVIYSFDKSVKCSIRIITEQL